MSAGHWWWSSNDRCWKFSAGFMSAVAFVLVLVAVVERYSASMTTTTAEIDRSIDNDRHRSETIGNATGTAIVVGRKRLPEAIIIGVKKAGTRALLEYLRLHPSIRAPGPETHFFDRHYHLGLDWYRSQMPTTTEDQLTIEKTPGYFIRREVPARVKHMSPDTKLLVVVRDPVTRLISDYTQSVSKKKTRKTFDQMAFLDPDGQKSAVDVSWSAVRIGFYYKHTQKWLRHFPKEQILFISGERLASDPVDELRTVERFLRLSPFVQPEHFVWNATKGFPCVKKRPDSGYRCLGKSKGRTHPHVSPKTLRRLSEFYRPFNDMFFRLVGRDFGWNDNLTVH